MVVILSVALALFLLLATVATIKIIQILNHLKHITEKAQRLADKAEAVGEFFQRAAGPLAIGRLITNVADNVFRRTNTRRTKSKGEDDDA